MVAVGDAVRSGCLSRHANQSRTFEDSEISVPEGTEGSFLHMFRDSELSTELMVIKRDRQQPPFALYGSSCRWGYLDGIEMHRHAPNTSPSMVDSRYRWDVGGKYRCRNGVLCSTYTDAASRASRTQRCRRSGAG